MADWITKLDDFLKLSDRELTLLVDAGIDHKPRFGISTHAPERFLLVGQGKARRGGATSAER